MNCEPIVVVIGIGPHGQDLTPEALAHIRRSRVAGRRQTAHLSYFPDWQGERLEIDADLSRVIERLKQVHLQSSLYVVLASGDPLLYGIGRKLLENFSREELIFLPHVSSVQLAFARLKEPWEDAVIVSLHGRPMDMLRPALAAGAAKIRHPYRWHQRSAGHPRTVSDGTRPRHGAVYRGDDQIGENHRQSVGRTMRFLLAPCRA